MITSINSTKYTLNINPQNMKRILIIVIFILIALTAKAFDFSAVCSSGQKLYFNIIDGTNQVEIVAPNNDPDYLWDGFAEPKGRLVLPSSVKYQNKEYIVTKVGELAFNGCDKITELTIPNTITVIDSYSFETCVGLKQLYIPGSVTVIGDRAFSQCSNLESITIDPQNPVYDSRDNCNAIIKTSTNELILGCGNTVIPHSVTKIARWAFYLCTNLKTITIPNSVIDIEEDAFGSCQNLTSIRLSENLTELKGFVFFGCKSLTSIVIPEGVRSIGSYAFASCSMLKTIILPSTLTNMHEKTFNECNSLQTVVMKSTSPLSNRLFNVNNCQLVVPCGSREAYERSFFGKGFKTIEEDCTP